MSQFKGLAFGSVTVDELEDLSLEELVAVAEAIAPIVDDVEDPFGAFDAIVASRPYLQEGA
jgi:hypothetical protein